MAHPGTNQPQPNDADLVTQSLAGNAAAFNLLIERHQFRLKRLLRVILRHPLDVEDIQQETLLRAFLGLEQLRDPTRFGAWLCSIAINLARRQRKIYFPEEPVEVTRDELIAAATQPSPETVAVKQELVERVREAIADLPSAEREAITLVYLNQLSHQEVAGYLGVTPGAVKVRVHRGRHRLQKDLREEFGPVVPGNRLKEQKMIKVKVHDIMIVSPQDSQGKPKLTLGNLLNLRNRALLLKEETGDRAIDIWLSICETNPIIAQLEQQEVFRPLTHDLTRTLLDWGHVAIKQVLITRLSEKTFYSTMTVKAGSKVIDVDCRPSDAISLALRLEAPIFVTVELMDQLGFRPDTEGNYTWPAYLERDLIKAKTEEEKSNLAKQRQWNWQSVLTLDLDQVAQQYVDTGEQAWQWIRGLDEETMKQYSNAEKRDFIVSRLSMLLGR